MFEGIISFFKKFSKNEEETAKSKDTAKERLHLVLMQDRANVSADFLDMMKQEIIEVIKKYIEVDEKEIDVKLTNKTNDDGSIGAPALYANIPIAKIKNENKEKLESVETNKDKNDEENKEIKPEAREKVKDKEIKKDKKPSNEEKQDEANSEEKILEKNKEEHKEEIQEEKDENSEKNKVEVKETKSNKKVTSKKKKSKK